MIKVLGGLVPSEGDCVTHLLPSDDLLAIWYSLAISGIPSLREGQSLPSS